MSVILSFSPAPGDDWQVANRLFFWFEAVFQSRYSDAKLREWIDIIGSISGYELHELAESEPDEARRLVAAMKDVAYRVFTGEYEIPDGITDDKQRLQGKFAELSHRLSVFEHGHGWHRPSKRD